MHGDAPFSDIASAALDARLVAVLARRCRHATAVLGDDARVWEHALAAEVDGRVQALAPPEAAAREVFTTVIDVATSALSAGEVASHAVTAWELVAPGGYLYVVAANGDAARPRHDVRMRVLRRLLREIAPVSMLGDQPFAWIVAEMKKRLERPPIRRRDRYDVTVDLCIGDVIELGCATGDLSAAIQAAGHRVVGIDMNEDKIAAARQRYPDVPFQQADITELAIADGSFDTAILAEVLEHVPETVGDQMLDAAWRLIRPGGRLIVSVPNEDMVPHPNHVREFSARSLLSSLRRYGRPVLSTAQPFKWILAHVEKR